jgi:prepilin-type processing-associated H-X9-DG protein
MATGSDPIPAGTADHIIPHLRMTVSDVCDVDSLRHNGWSNYNFVDGHAAPRDVRVTFDPAKQLDWWNPLLAT